MPKTVNPTTLFKLNCFIDDAKHARVKTITDGLVPGLRYDTKKSGVAVVLKYKKTKNRYSSHTLQMLKFESISKSQLATIRRQANELRDDFEQQFLNTVGSSDKTLPQLLDIHYQSFLTATNKRNNLRKYSEPFAIRCLKAIFNKYDFFDNLPLCQFNPKTEHDFIQLASQNITTKGHRRYKPVTQETIRKYINALRSFLNHLISQNELEVFPFGKYPLKDTSVKKQTAINPKQFKLLLDFLYQQNTQEADFYYLALCTGARKNELLELDKPNIDLSTGIITLDKTKNGNGRRCYVLNERMQDVITRNLDNHSNYLFFNEYSKYGYLHLDDLTQQINDEFNLKGFTFHSTRHSFAIYLYEQKVDINSIKERLGHSNIEQTLRYLGSLDVFREEKAKQVNAQIASAF